MFDNGLIQEVENIKGIYKDGCTALQAIGYKEVVSYLDDNNKDMESLKELIKINTRHYAKRQITWFKQYDDFKWFDIDSYSDRSDLIEAITEYINSRINK